MIPSDYQNAPSDREYRATFYGSHAAAKRVVMHARWVRVEETGAVVCALRFAWGDAAPGVDITTCMRRVHEAAAWPLDPADVDLGGWPVDADGRGLSAMETGGA